MAKKAAKVEAGPKKVYTRKKPQNPGRLWKGMIQNGVHVQFLMLGTRKIVLKSAVAPKVASRA